MATIIVEIKEIFIHSSIFIQAMDDDSFHVLLSQITIYLALINAYFIAFLD